MWQQLLGGNVMLYYLVYIFEMAGIVSLLYLNTAAIGNVADSPQGGNAALTSSIVQYVIFLITTGGILPVIDRISRRFLLISGGIICCILHFITGALMASYGHHVDEINGGSRFDS